MADAYEPDDWPWDAKTLSVGAAAQQHTFHRPGDSDWSRFSVVAGMAYLFDLTASSGTDLAWAIHAPSAQSAADDSIGEALASGPDGRTVWRASITGVHLLEVKERTGRGGQGFSYTLAVTALDRRIFLPLITTGAAAASSATAIENVRSDDLSRPARYGATEVATTNDAVFDGGAAIRLSGRAAAARADDQPPAGVQALALDARSGDLYVVGQDTLARYDPTGKQILAQTSIGREPGGIVLDAARGGSMLPAASRARSWRSTPAPWRPSLVSAALRSPAGWRWRAIGSSWPTRRPASCAAVAADDFRVTAVTQVGPGPYAVAALPAQGRVFVAQSGGDSVARLDASTGELVGVTALGGLGHPQGMVADVQAGKVYVIYMLSPRYRQIAILDGVTGAVERIIPATLDRPLTYRFGPRARRRAGPPAGGR